MKKTIIILLSVLLIIGVIILGVIALREPDSNTNNVASEYPDVNVVYVSQNDLPIDPSNGVQYEGELSRGYDTVPYERNEAGTGFVVEPEDEYNMTDLEKSAPFSDGIAKVGDEPYISDKIPNDLCATQEVLTVLSQVMDENDYYSVFLITSISEPVYNESGSIVGITGIQLFDIDGHLYLCNDDTTEGATIMEVPKSAIHSMGESLGVDLSYYE